MNNLRFQRISWLQIAAILMILSGVQGQEMKPDKPSGGLTLSRPGPDAGDQQAVEWNLGPSHREFDITTKGIGAMLLKGIEGSVVINGKRFYLKNARILTPIDEVSGKKMTPGSMEYALPGVGCTWVWQFNCVDNGLEIESTLRNSGDVPLVIGDWDVVHLSQSQGGDFEVGENHREVRFFRWHTWDMGVEKLDCEDGHHTSDNFCLLYNPASGQTLMSAFISIDRMHCRHHLDYSASGGIEEYRATCRFGRYALTPGQQLMAEKLRFSFPADPYRALETWADQIHTLKQPVFEELPPVGLANAWLDTWNEQEGGYAEVSINNARALRDKLKGFDIEIYRVSTFTALKKGIPGNWLEADEPHFTFTNGYENFLIEIQKLGFKPGVWVAPFWFCSEADKMLEENRANLLRDCEGKPISQPLNWSGNRADTTYLSKLHQYYLDGTHPGTRELLKKIFTHNRNIGIRFYMLDFLQVPGNSCLYDPSKTPLQAAGNMLEVIRETAGDGTHLQTAVSSTPAYCGLIDAARVGRDFGEGRPLQGAPLSDWGNATVVLHDNHYANTYYLLQNAAASYFTHRRLYINDLNELTIDKPLPLEYAHIAATVFGLCGSPLMLGDDYRRISEERLRMVKLCLPRTRDWPVPVDLFDHVHPDDYSRYLKLQVVKPWGTYLLIAVFNNDDSAYEAELDFARLGLDGEKDYRIYEFWTEEYCGTYKTGFSYVVPPDACRLFRISEAREYPWLLSTDMHIQQGSVEVEALKWDEQSKCLSGTVTRPVGEVGNLYFLMPRSMRVTDEKGLFLLKDLNDMCVIIRKEIYFNNEHEKFEIRFGAWDGRDYLPPHLLPGATEQEWLDDVREHLPPGNTRVIK